MHRCYVIWYYGIKTQATYETKDASNPAVKGALAKKQTVKRQSNLFVSCVVLLASSCVSALLQMWVLVCAGCCPKKIQPKNALLSLNCKNLSLKSDETGNHKAWNITTPRAGSINKLSQGAGKRSHWDHNLLTCQLNLDTSARDPCLAWLPSSGSPKKANDDFMAWHGFRSKFIEEKSYASWRCAVRKHLTHWPLQDAMMAGKPDTISAACAALAVF